MVALAEDKRYRPLDRPMEIQIECHITRQPVGWFPATPGEYFPVIFESEEWRNLGDGEGEQFLHVHARARLNCERIEFRK